MPSTLHEALIEMFRHRPSLAAELLADALGFDLPAYQQARVEPGGFTDLTPTEYRADAVVLLTVADVPVLAVVGRGTTRPRPGQALELARLPGHAARPAPLSDCAPGGLRRGLHRDLVRYPDRPRSPGLGALPYDDDSAYAPQDGTPDRIKVDGSGTGPSSTRH
jgi:hypothetical protein